MSSFLNTVESTNIKVNKELKSKVKTQLEGVTTVKGQMDISNDLETKKATIKYNDTTNSLDFIFG